MSASTDIVVYADLVLAVCVGSLSPHSSRTKAANCDLSPRLTAAALQFHCSLKDKQNVFAAA